MERAYVYGDSLLKATVPDEAMRYHFHLAEVMAQYPTERLEVVNRAKMGSTISKGLSLVEHDVQRGMDARWALVAYGGNDSDFDWAGIAADPEGEHKPRTELPEFLTKLKKTVTELLRAGVQPVLMTLPPIDGMAGRRGPHLPASGAVLRHSGVLRHERGAAPHRRAPPLSAAAEPAADDRGGRHSSDHAGVQAAVRRAGPVGHAAAVTEIRAKGDTLWYVL